jgi:RNA polymerase sigma-70 factor (ECF subfamily)
MASDPRDFDAVIAEHAAFLGRVAATYEREPAAREELLQEIALAVWRALPSFRGQSTIRTFLGRIAHHRAVSHVVRRVRRRREGPWLDDDETSEQRRATQEVADPSPSPEETAIATESSEALFGAVRDLPLPQRQTVSLILEGWSHREIGEALGMTENHVAVTVHRAKKALARSLRARGAT